MTGVKGPKRGKDVAPLILCIDDEADICQLLDTILSLSGYRTRTAMNARDALAGMADKPDLVMLDINLPDMDGIELCRRLRATNGRVPVLFLTAATGARRREAMAAGGSAFVEKPFDVDELLSLIERLLAAPHERRGGGERRRVPEGVASPDRRMGDRRRPAWSEGSSGPASNPSTGTQTRRASRQDGYPLVARSHGDVRGRGSRGA